LKNVQDASGVETCIRNGQFKADDVIAVIGKTEGNGGVNDFTRILADQAFRAVLKKLGSRSEAEIAKIPMVWSGGCDGVITPHATVFARNSKPGQQIAAGHRHGDERRDLPGGYRPAGDGGEGCRRRARGDA
jgi:cyanuric acid amidohydrolase